MDQGLISQKNWSRIAQLFQQPGGVPMPFLKEIFLMECRIAGTSHVPEIRERTQDVLPGSLVQFRREAENPADSLAILILNDKGEKIGYVPREKNEVLARLMDAGKCLFGKVEDKSQLGDYVRIVIRTYMQDV
ncbi:MAG: HIRAN domain-containing protein [Oligosphaeraceae bacterium]